jgi:hypothetical protein
MDALTPLDRATLFVSALTVFLSVVGVMIAWWIARPDGQSGVDDPSRTAAE